jgi:hypothetical protein
MLKLARPEKSCVWKMLTIYDAGTEYLLVGHTFLVLV